MTMFRSLPLLLPMLTLFVSTVLKAETGYVFPPNIILENGSTNDFALVKGDAPSSGNVPKTFKVYNVSFATLNSPCNGTLIKTLTTSLPAASLQINRTSQNFDIRATVTIDGEDDRFPAN